MFEGICDGQAPDELVHICQCDGTFATGEVFQEFIRLSDASPAQDGLIGLGEDLRVSHHVFVHELAIGTDLAEPLGGAAAGEEHVAEGHAQVAQHSAASEVTLQA